jgi:hypothetical protein
MNKDLAIGTVINSLLSANTDLVAIVDDKIFPLMAAQDTTFPFIAYTRKDVEPQYTKDIYTGDKITMEIVAAAKNEEEAVNIANLIRDTVDNVKGLYNGINIRKVRMTHAYEDYFDENNAYAQDLEFEITI